MKTRIPSKIERFPVRPQGSRLVRPPLHTSKEHDELIAIIRRAPAGMTLKEALTDGSEFGMATRKLVSMGVSDLVVQENLSLFNRPVESTPSPRKGWSAEDSATLWYAVDVSQRYNDITTFEVLKGLAGEISDWTQILPVSAKETRKGFFKKHYAQEFENHNIISVNDDNTFNVTIQGVRRSSGVTLLYLSTLMTWAIDRMSGSQVRTQEGFEGYKQGISLFQALNKAEAKK